MLSSSHADSMDFPGSLSICLYHPLNQAGPPTYIQCLYRADVCSY